MKRHWPLAAVLLFAAALRALFFTGTLGGDDLLYRIYAHNLLEIGLSPLDHWSARPAFIALMATAERLLGTSDAAAAVVPGLFGLAGIAAVYAAGCLAASRAAGAAAAVVAATVPNSVYWGGVPLTDGPAAALMAVSAALFMRAWRGGRGAAAAGAVAGAAWLVRESAVLMLAFFALAFLTNRRAAAFAFAGFLAVLAGEAVCFAFWTGDPLGRFHLAAGDPSVIEGERLHQPDLVRRLTVQIPSMMANPADPAAPYFGLLFLTVVACIVCLWRRRDEAVRLPMGWLLAIFVATMWLPQSISPLRLAIHAHPQKLEPLVAPAALAIGVTAATAAGRARLVLGGLAAATVLSNLGLCALLKFDNDHRLDGARWAYARVAGGAVADERTVLLYGLWDGFPGTPRVRICPADAADLPPGTTAIVNEQFIGFAAHTGTMVPDPLARPPATWERLEEHVTPGRRRIRAWLTGRDERAWNDTRTILYRVR